LKFRNYILTLLFLATSSFKSFGTGQIADILIYNADTFAIFSNPLEQLSNIETLRPILFGDKQGCHSTACWRGYKAEWEIINKELYLVGIYSCCFYEDKIKANLIDLFGSKCKQGKVKADWVTGKMLSPQGKLLYYVHMGYGSLYEKEVVYEFENGQLKDIITYDNSKSRKSIYSQNTNLQNFIYSNINWDILPKEDKIIKVFVLFSANEQGIIDSVKVIRGFDKIFDEEALRVIKLIPEWDVFYRLGKHERQMRSMPIFFSQENKRKYKKD
jgi:hypothetical protein